MYTFIVLAGMIKKKEKNKKVADVAASFKCPDPKKTKLTSVFSVKDKTVHSMETFQFLGWFVKGR